MWWPWKPRKKYDVVEYWNNRDNPNSKNPNERNTELHINYVKSNIDELDKILDFGPGVGRILPAYYRKNKVTGYDISSNYKERLLKAAKEEEINLELVIETKKITKFAFLRSKVSSSNHSCIPVKKSSLVDISNSETDINSGCM